jgi:NAD(P)-dependent dehydrogenase (short-subunit alcohol dehydrogenase family)
MLKAAQGCVVNVGGGAARSPGADSSIGASVNAAMGNFSKAISQLGKRDGVNVNVIHPGTTETERFYQSPERRSKASGKSVDQLKQEGTARGRPISPRQRRGRFRAHSVSLLRKGALHPRDRYRGRWRLNGRALLNQRRNR